MKALSKRNFDMVRREKLAEITLHYKTCELYWQNPSNSSCSITKQQVCADVVSAWEEITFHLLNFSLYEVTEEKRKQKAKKTKKQRTNHLLLQTQAKKGILYPKQTYSTAENPIVNKLKQTNKESKRNKR